jgi:hypothetical protein
MVVTYEQIGVLLRQRTGDPPHQRLRYQALVRDGLQRLARRAAKSSTLRHYFLTPRSVTVSLDADGAGDLGSVAGYAVMLDAVMRGRLYLTGAASPLARQSGASAGLQGCYDKALNFYAQEGANITVTGPDAANGTLELAVPFVPTLAQLHENCVDLLMDELERLLKGNPQEYLAKATAQ